MNDDLLFNRGFSILDDRCSKLADTAFKDALNAGTGDAVRSWCRLYPRRMVRAFDWLTEHRDNERVKDLIDREIERLRAKRSYLLAIYVAVVSSAISILATWLCSDTYRFSTTKQPLPPPAGQPLSPQ